MLKFKLDKVTVYFQIN